MAFDLMANPRSPYTEAAEELKRFMRSAPYKLCSSSTLLLLKFQPSIYQFLAGFACTEEFESDSILKRTLKEAVELFSDLSGNLSDTLTLTNMIIQMLQQLQPAQPDAGLAQLATQRMHAMQPIQSHSMGRTFQEHLTAACQLQIKWNNLKAGAMKLRSRAEAGASLIHEIQENMHTNRKFCDSTNVQAATLVAVGAGAAVMTSKSESSMVPVVVAGAFLAAAAVRKLMGVAVSSNHLHSEVAVNKAKVPLNQAEGELQHRIIPILDRMIALVAAMCAMSDALVEGMRGLSCLVASNSARAGMYSGLVSQAGTLRQAIAKYTTEAQRYQGTWNGGLVNNREEIAALRASL